MDREDCIFNELINGRVKWHRYANEIYLFCCTPLNTHKLLAKILLSSLNDHIVVKIVTCSEEYVRCGIKTYSTSDFVPSIALARCNCGARSGVHLMFRPGWITVIDADRNQENIGESEYIDEWSQVESRLYKKLKYEVVDDVYNRIIEGDFLRGLKAELLKDVLDFLISHDDEFGTKLAGPIINTQPLCKHGC